MLRRLFCTVLICAAGSFAASSAYATPITADTWYEFGFGGEGSDLVSGVGTVPGTNSPDGNPIVQVGDAPWTISVTEANQALIVLDAFTSIDQFEFFNNLTSLGVSSTPVTGGLCDSDLTCALNDLSYSRLVVPLAIGDYSFTGIQTAGIPGAGFFTVTDNPDATVPEPVMLLLLGTGAAVIARRRWQRAPQD